MNDGIYFDMPEAVYHRINRFSSSGIQNMLISPATFWASSWMNRDREDRDETHHIVGRAYHCARLEPERFSGLYVCDLVKEDLPDALKTDAEIKAELKDMGEAMTKAGEGVVDRAKRLAAAGYKGQIWHLERAAWEAENEEAEALAPKVWDEIQRDVDAIQHNVEIAEHLTGGAAEVTILWTCEQTGVAMKARLDYLKPVGLTDFKTFDNSRGKNLYQAITDAFRYNRYYIQASLYWQAAEVVRGGGLTIVGKATSAQTDLIKSITDNPNRMEVWYVFQEKRGVPNLLAYRFATHDAHPAAKAGAPDEGVALKYAEKTAIFRKAEAAICHAKQVFLTMAEVYGLDGDPWYPINPLGVIDDDSFNPYWLDGDE